MKKQTRSSNLETALRYASLGFRVVPRDHAKKPLLRGWPDVATTDPATITRWWTNAYSDALVGIVVSSDFCVLDVDPDRGGAESLASLGTLPTTPTATTPSGGQHVFFSTGGRPPKTTIDFLPGLELRAEGLHVAAPPEAGRIWLPGLAPWQVPMAPLPESIRSLLTHARRKNDPRKEYTDPRNEYRYSLLASSPISWAKVKAALTRTAVALAAMRCIGIHVRRLGEKFCCPIHPEQHPSAALWRDEGDPQSPIMLHCFHDRGRAWWTLPEVYATYKVGLPRQFKKEASWSLWGVRLLADVGCLELADVPWPRLEIDGAPAGLTALWADLHLLYRCRATLGHTGGAPLSNRFLADWCGVSAATARRYKTQCLIPRGYLERCGATEGGWALWRVGKPRDAR